MAHHLSTCRLLSLACIAAACLAGELHVQAADPSQGGPLRLFTVDRDGSQAKQLAEAILPGMDRCGSPEWSHDGTRIAFDASPEDRNWLRSRIAVYHVIGSKRGQTDDLGLGNAPSWSPDDSRVAFFLNDGASGERGGIWTMNADGTDRQWLCTGWFPNWSPDGRYIALTNGSAARELILYEVPTRTVRTFAAGRLTIKSQAAWSRDGKKLAVISLAPQLQPSQSIAVWDVATEELEQVLWQRARADSPNRLDAAHVSWSPHHDELVVRFRDGGPQHGKV